MTRRDIMLLAAETGLDPRTIQRAAERGLSALKAEKDRELLRQAAKKKRIPMPEQGG